MKTKKKKKKKSKALGKLKNVVNRFRGKPTEGMDDQSDTAHPRDAMGISSEAQRPVMAKETEETGPKPGRMRDTAHKAFAHMKDVVKKLRRKKHKVRN